MSDVVQLKQRPAQPKGRPGNGAREALTAYFDSNAFNEHVATGGAQLSQADHLLLWLGGVGFLVVPISGSVG